MCVIVRADAPRERRLWIRVEFDVIKSYPVATILGAVAEAPKADDVIEAGTDLRVHTGQRELRRRDRLAQLRSADDDLSLNQHVVEINCDAITRIRAGSIQTKRGEGDREQVIGLKRRREIEVNTLLIVRI